MIESTTYMDSLDKGELVPMMTLGGFQNPEEDEWTMREMMEIGEKAQQQFDGDMEHNAVSCAFVYCTLDVYVLGIHNMT